MSKRARVLYVRNSPHFIRCVVPNTYKIHEGVESGLVMHQYQCNGVLAGIAICRAGFPNKLPYPEFKARYNIIAARAVAKAKNDKAAAGAVKDVERRTPTCSACEERGRGAPSIVMGLTS